nr:type II secretion system protein [uncultured Roseateles sp.]
MTTQRGFTLVELMVTLTILAVLSMVALPLAQMSAQRQREAELRRALWEIRDAIDSYKKAWDTGRIPRNIGDSGYPPSLDLLAQGIVDEQSPRRERFYLLRRVPRDPFCDCPERSAAQTWGWRSYASPPDDPKPGRDVYDVYSQADGRGLNGILYRQW